MSCRISRAVLVVYLDALILETVCWDGWAEHACACFPKGKLRALAESRCTCQQLLRTAVFKRALSLSTASTLSEWGENICAVTAQSYMNIAKHT